MPSTFFGLNIAYSGLSAYQTALNTTANNISNVQTKGYTRQQANRVASDALRVYAKYGSAGTGVSTTSIMQVRNQYYDNKYWYNQSSVGMYETRLNYLQQIENYYIDDDTAHGFNTILNKMFSSLDTLKNSAGDQNVRQQFVGSAQNLATYFNSVASGMSELQDTTNEEIKSTVQNINSIAQKIATLNQQINVIELQGGYANELRDQRALLVDELSSIVPTEVSEVPVTNSNYPDMQLGSNYYTVKIGGQILVDTYDYETLTCVSRENKINQSDNEGLYDIKWSKTGNKFEAGASYMSGTLKGLFDVRDGNNSANLNGSAKVLDSKHINVPNPSITSVEAMTMPEQGILTINGKDYKYTSFSFAQDPNGKITSFTFELEDALSTQEIALTDGMKMSIGAPVDSMGIPYYMSQMNQFLRAFASAFNAIENSDIAQDINGGATNDYSFFTAKDKVSGNEYLFNGATPESYYKMTASNFCVSNVAIEHPERVATTVQASDGVDAYDIFEKLALLKSDTVLYRGGTADGFLKSMITDISVDAQESKVFYQNFSNISNTINNQRLSVSGVDEDEEALDLIKFQNAYNLSSKMISVMTEIYDKLIQETGV